MRLEKLDVPDRKELDSTSLDLIEKAIKNDLDTSSLLVDDSDFPVAANVVEFFLDQRFLNWKPFPRQIQIAMHVFQDFCPLCTPKRWQETLYDQPIEEILEHVVFLQHGVCPRCGLGRHHLVEAKAFKGWINEVVGVAGQRSSKSYLTAVLSLYLLHRYLKLPAIPYRFFRLAPTLLHYTFVALTYGQASDNLWDPFLEFYNQCKWFQEYNEMLAEKQAKLGRKLFEVKKSFICYYHKRLILYPSGPDKRKLRGRTRFGYAIDEFAYFDSAPGSKSVKFNASEIYAALDNSLETVRAAVKVKRSQGYYNIPDAYSFLISSPVSKQDKIMQMLRTADRVSSRYAFHYPTWEINPNIKFEHLQDKFEKDPVNAWRDFGADPPLNDSPLFSNTGIVREMFRGFPNLFKTTQVEKGSYVYAKVKLTRKPRKVTIVGLDAGLSNNSFAVAVLSVGSRIRIEGVFEVIPMNDKTVNFAYMQETLRKICNVLSPKAVFADRWNSVSFLHSLEDEDIYVSQLSLTYKDFRNIVGLVYEKSLVAPTLEKGVTFDDLLASNFDYPTYFLNKPVAHLAYQFLTVRDTGRRVDKGIEATDDLFRAVCVAYCGYLDLLEADMLNVEEEEADDAIVPRPSEALGVSFPKGKSLPGIFTPKVTSNNSTLLGTYFRKKV